ncbi:MAG: AAA family ATPase [Myxococcales bacterium]|nr:AAA family ATPase [Myxococcales bacterium]
MGLREDLLRPEAYPAPSTASVELRETHASWVYLTEGDVYKVKRPVDLGFLDFHTVELRRAACEAELMLNRRLAASVYLGVVPVRLGPDGRHHFGPEGEVVDWAVHMLRLDDHRTADALLAARALTERHVDRLAAHLAAFHGRCRADEATRAFGSPAAVRAHVVQNFEQTRGHASRLMGEAQAREVEAWQLGFLDKHGARIQARADAGKSVDGHGDLRLEHVYIDERGDITVLDCVEFSDALRAGDTASDVSFLSMDLAAHGRVDLAERLLARYARETDDFDLYGVVDFYESYRAWVRAKVATMLSRDPGVDTRVSSGAEAVARRHYLLALAAERKSLISPRVVAVGGVIASGKSTLGQIVGDDLGAPVVDADRARKSMLGVEHTARLEEGAFSGAYSKDLTARVYDEVLRRASVVLDSGRPVVVDASFRSAEMRAKARALATRHGVPFLLVECTAPAEVCRERLRERAKTASVSDGRLEVFDAFCASWEPITELSAEEHLRVDTSRPTAASVADVEARVPTWPKGLDA